MVLRIFCCITASVWHVKIDRQNNVSLPFLYLLCIFVCVPLFSLIAISSLLFSILSLFLNLLLPSRYCSYIPLSYYLLPSYILFPFLLFGHRDITPSHIVVMACCIFHAHGRYLLVICIYFISSFVNKYELFLSQGSPPHPIILAPSTLEEVPRFKWNLYLPSWSLKLLWSKSKWCREEN